MLRLVFGLARGRWTARSGIMPKSYAWTTPRLSPTDYETEEIHAAWRRRHFIKDNVLSSADLDEIFTRDIKTDKALFASLDTNTANSCVKLGHRGGKTLHLMILKSCSKIPNSPPL